jgi:hypothetical protein
MKILHDNNHTFLDILLNDQFLMFSNKTEQLVYCDYVCFNLVFNYIGSIQV